MSYVSTSPASPPPASECVLCALPKLGDDRAALVLARGTHCYAVLNRFPYTNGHMMIVPFAHIEALPHAPQAILAEMMRFAQRAQTSITERMGAHGFNLGMNLGRAAGGSIAHLHMHLVPRWIGDTNFMPVVGETHVMPQHIDETYERLLGGITL